MTTTDAELVLPAVPTSPRAARHWVQARLHDLGLDALGTSVLLLTSEVVTNAMKHAGTPLQLRLLPSGPGVRIEVRDGSLAPPVRRAVTPEATEGRGIGLLEDIADEWGWRREGNGKTVWFRVLRPRETWDGVVVDLRDDEAR